MHLIHHMYYMYHTNHMCVPCLLDWQTDPMSNVQCPHLSWKLNTMLGLSVHVPVSAAGSLNSVTQSVSD